MLKIFALIGLLVLLTNANVIQNTVDHQLDETMRIEPKEYENEHPIENKSAKLCCGCGNFPPHAYSCSICCERPDCLCTMYGNYCKCY